jgi:hypothetical protein
LSDELDQLIMAIDDKTQAVGRRVKDAAESNTTAK